MTRFISHVHTEIRRTRTTRRGATHDAKDVPQGLHKEYPRMQRVALPEPTPLTCPLSTALETRRSQRTVDPDIPLTLEECGTLLGAALRVRAGTHHRNYPSGGALYPIETYLITTALESAAPGVFHYHPTAHALERLWDIPASLTMKSLVPKPDDLIFSSLIVFTSVWDRSSAKYGDFTYSLALLEAGHMSENILLVSAALGLRTCPMAGFDDQNILSVLDLDEETEQPVHSITLGKAAQTDHPTSRSREE